MDKIIDTKKEPILVLVRFTEEELNTMKMATGATANATAVVCFVRKNLSNGL